MDGLRYHQDFLSSGEEKKLLDRIDVEPWLEEGSVRVQHYGYKYDYRKRRIDTSAEVAPVPNWAKAFAKRLVSYDFLKKMPDQLIVSEYLPGQGVPQHIESVACFDSIIGSINLGSGCMTRFVSIIDKSEYDFYLEQRSAVSISKSARYSWTHGVAAVTGDDVRNNGNVIPRGRRVCLTFRNVLPS